MVEPLFLKILLYLFFRNYCPLIQNEKRLKYGLPISLKMTKRQSDGQVRKH